MLTLPVLLELYHLSLVPVSTRAHTTFFYTTHETFRPTADVIFLHIGASQHEFKILKSRLGRRH